MTEAGRDKPYTSNFNGHLYPWNPDTFRESHGLFMRQDKDFIMILTISASDLLRRCDLLAQIARYNNGPIADGDRRDTFHFAAAGEGEIAESALLQFCLRGDAVVGYQRLAPARRAAPARAPVSRMGLDEALRSPGTFEWSQPCSLVSEHHRILEPDSPFLELTQGMVEWGLASDVSSVVTSIHWPLMAAAAQLGFSVRPLGLPEPNGCDEITALSLSFTRQTLAAIRLTRQSDIPVLRQ